MYNRVNGFGTPDLIASLDSEEKLNEAFQLIAAQKHPVSVLLDDAIIEVDTRQGIKRDNPVLGKQYMVSILNLKARLRASELAEALLTHCTITKNSGVKNGWYFLRCEHKG